MMVAWTTMSGATMPWIAVRGLSSVTATCNDCWKVSCEGRQNSEWWGTSLNTRSGIYSQVSKCVSQSRSALLNFVHQPSPSAHIRLEVITCDPAFKRIKSELGSMINFHCHHFQHQIYTIYFTIASRQ